MHSPIPDASPHHLPLQVRLLTVNDEVLPYAQAVVEEMTRAGVRAEVQGGASIPKLVGAGSMSKAGDRGRSTEAGAELGGRLGWQSCHLDCGFTRQLPEG